MDSQNHPYPPPPPSSYPPPPPPNPYAPPQNVYAPPQAPYLGAGAGFAGEPPFYVVSPVKMAVMALGTVGFYEIYWFYKHWERYKRASGADIWPLPRAIFAIFFTHSLFRTADEKLRADGRSYPWSPGTLATGYVVLAIAGRVLDRMAGRSIGSPWTDLASLGVMALGIFLLVQGQQALNLAAGDPEGASNSRFTAANFGWLLLGLVIWFLVLLGAFYVPE